MILNYSQFRCLKKIAGFTQSAFVECLKPVILPTYVGQGLKLTKAPSHVLDDSVEMLILWWIATRTRLIGRGHVMEWTDIEVLQLGLNRLALYHRPI